MKTLITGGAGFIGSYLANKLIDLTYDIDVVDSGIRGDYDRLNPEAKIFNIDLRNNDEISALDKNYDLIIHLAAINGTDNFYSRHHDVFEVGVKSILNLYDYFKNTGASIIVASSAEVYQRPPIIPTDENIPCTIPDLTNFRYSYAGSKLFSELLVMNYGIDFFKKAMIFRPHNIYGPNMGYKHVVPQLIIKLLNAKKSGDDYITLVGDGKETRAFCFIHDLINGLEILIKKGENRNIYHIGNDFEISIYELASMIRDILSIDIDIRPGENTHKGGTDRRCPDITKMKKLGYSPQVSLEDGLRQCVDWYEKNFEKSEDNLLL